MRPVAHSEQFCVSQTAQRVRIVSAELSGLLPAATTLMSGQKERCVQEGGKSNLMLDFETAKFAEKRQTSGKDLILTEKVKFDGAVATNSHGEHIVGVALKGWSLQYVRGKVESEYALGFESVKVDVGRVDGREVEVVLTARLDPKVAGYPGFEFDASGEAQVWAVIKDGAIAG